MIVIQYYLIGGVRECKQVVEDVVDGRPAPAQLDGIICMTPRTRDQAVEAVDCHGTVECMVPH